MQRLEGICFPLIGGISVSGLWVWAMLVKKKTRKCLYRAVLEMFNAQQTYQLKIFVIIFISFFLPVPPFLFFYKTVALQNFLCKNITNKILMYFISQGFGWFGWGAKNATIRYCVLAEFSPFGKNNPEWDISLFSSCSTSYWIFRELCCDEKAQFCVINLKIWE